MSDELFEREIIPRHADGSLDWAILGLYLFDALLLLMLVIVLTDWRP